MRVTIKSIAKDLNISHMTVSRALSGSPNVNPETRKLIMARAKELGYVKSSAANAMRGDPTAIVGLLLPNIINEFYARFANALAVLCADRNLDLVIHLTNDEPAREHQSLLRLQALQATAVIMVPTPHALTQAQNPPSSMRIIEFIRTRHRGKTDAAILIDDAPAIGEAVDHLVERGFKRLSFIGADSSMSSGRHRVQAFLDALSRHGITPEPSLIRTGAPSFDMGHAEMTSMLDSTAPPDALVCGGFEISNGALEACLERGIQFPKDLGFVGYGDPAAYQWIAGGLTTISMSADDIAARAMQKIMEEETSVGVSASITLSVRQST